MGIRSRRNGGATEHLVPGDDGGGRVRLARGLAKAARVHLERGARLDEGDEQRLVQLRGRGEVRRGDVRMEVALDEVEVADRVEEAGADRALDFVEVRRDDLRQRSARDPRMRRGTRGTASRRRRGRCR